MNRDKVFAILRERQPELHSQGVKSLAVFGSVARGDSSVVSDVDILVEFNQEVGLFEFIRLKLDLEQWIGCQVDLVTPDALRPELRQQILDDAIYVYETD